MSDRSSMGARYIQRGKLGIRGLYAMVYIELKALRSNPHILWSSILSPIMYYFFYSFGIQSTFGDISFHGTTVSFLSYSVVGILVMCLFNQMYQCVYRLIIDKRWGLLSLKLLNGVTPPVYILGISTFPLVGIALQTVLLYVLSSVFGGAFPASKLPLVIVFLVVAVLFWTSFYICVAMRIKNYKQRDFILNVVMMPVLFAAPIFYSFDSTPVVLQVISRINPLTYQLEMLRCVIYDVPYTNVLLLTVALTVIAMLAATWCLNHVDLSAEEH